jgi:serine/threonine protein kinase
MSREMIQHLLIERMTVAYDLAAAFFYLHEHRLVYRDIKPENIGFDIRGTVLCAAEMMVVFFSSFYLISEYISIHVDRYQTCFLSMWQVM